ncbi:penicillin acylase family protein [Aeromicrobium sp. UC242_57]|uniref:penicillin acylase family protein n=1 Tax=Aeromicrobium sp. UC242_57 TaxID=3374624 RepID=UPI0037B47325
MGQNDSVRRILIVIASLLAALLVAGAVFSFVTVRKSFPDTSGTVQIARLTDDVTIKRDKLGIPQIYADTPEDLFLAQGYVHAQDRFYEMDFRRHVTAGRLAELVGDGALETDKYVRTLGWRRVAEREVALLDDETRSLLRAYARGVNSYIDNRSASKLSLEYSVLSLTGPSYTPEPWTTVDSLAWIKAMAWDLRSNMDDEIDRVLATQNLPVEKVEASPRLSGRSRDDRRRPGRGRGRPVRRFRRAVVGCRAGSGSRRIAEQGAQRRRGVAGAARHRRRHRFQLVGRGRQAIADRQADPGQ